MVCLCVAVVRQKAVLLCGEVSVWCGSGGRKRVCVVAARVVICRRDECPAPTLAELLEGVGKVEVSMVGAQRIHPAAASLRHHVGENERRDV